jgi:hypothetical protein
MTNDKPPKAKLCTQSLTRAQHASTGTHSEPHSAARWSTFARNFGVTCADSKGFSTALVEDGNATRMHRCGDMDLLGNNMGTRF